MPSTPLTHESFSGVTGMQGCRALPYQDEGGLSLYKIGYHFFGPNFRNKPS